MHCNQNFDNIMLLVRIVNPIGYFCRKNTDHDGKKNDAFVVSCLYCDLKADSHFSSDRNGVMDRKGL